MDIQDNVKRIKWADTITERLKSDMRGDKPELALTHEERMLATKALQEAYAKEDGRSV